MRIHPAIAALRGTPASQRPPDEPRGERAAGLDLRSLRNAWLATDEVQTLLGELTAFGAGQDCARGSALGRLLTDHQRARAFVDALVTMVLAGLRNHPLGEAPFRHSVSQGLTTIQILEAPHATLSLAAYEPLSQEGTPDTVLFSDREVREIVVSGTAQARRYTHTDAGSLVSDQLAFDAGTTLTLRPRAQARHVLSVSRTLLVLQLTREPPRPAPTRLVDLETGETLRTASGDKSASQAVMALGVLGALHDMGSLSVMEATALNRDEDAEVRWESTRQLLALGPKRGLALLQTLADQSDDPIAAPARVLRERLLTSRPELRALVEDAAECRS
ncbi:MAG: hypothetical protein AAF251_09260 [Pseudomonadota bacterium]